MLEARAAGSVDRSFTKQVVKGDSISVKDLHTLQGGSAQAESVPTQSSVKIPRESLEARWGSVHDDFELLFEVADTVTGLKDVKNPADLFSVDGPSAVTSARTGLGLPLSKRVIEEMGGLIGLYDTSVHDPIFDSKPGSRANDKALAGRGYHLMLRFPEKTIRGVVQAGRNLLRAAATGFSRWVKCLQIENPVRTDSTSHYRCLQPLPVARGVCAGGRSSRLSRRTGTTVWFTVPMIVCDDAADSNQESLYPGKDGLVTVHDSTEFYGSTPAFADDEVIGHVGRGHGGGVSLATTSRLRPSQGDEDDSIVYQLRSASPMEPRPVAFPTANAVPGGSNGALSMHAHQQASKGPATSRPSARPSYQARGTHVQSVPR